MLALERQREILATLQSRRGVRVADLAAQFDVAEETIRRDLDKLESLGKLVRSHGGAVASFENESPHWQREFINQPQKQAIAREAIRQVEEGDTLILDASSTSWFMARCLPDIPLTIITNSLFVCMAMEEREHARILCPGGTLMNASMSFVGTAAVDALRRYHAGKLFMSCRAFDVKRGLSDLSDEQAMVRRAMLDISDRHILLADSSKWGTRALAIIGAATEMHCIITDEGAPAEEIDHLRNFGIEVEVAPVRVAT